MRCLSSVNPEAGVLPVRHLGCL